MDLDKTQLAIIGLIALALVLVFKEQWTPVIAIITLLGGILIPSPVGVSDGGS